MMLTTQRIQFKIILLIIASFFILAHSIPAAADIVLANEVATLKGDALKTYIADYALKHIPLQEGESIDVTVMQLDPNITLPYCTGSIDVSMSSQSVPEHANSVTLSCKDKPQWNIFIPINVKVFTQILVANRLIMSGETLSAEDATFEKQDKNHLPDGFFKDEQAIVGLVARYSINAGAVFNKRNTKQLPIVKKNQTITLLVKTGTVEIKMSGIAKSDGYLNDAIKILNPSSKKIIDAIVKDSNTAEINY